jgi:predicted phage-related endonuclease
MANDRNDFAPEIRNTAWWASDTRQAVNGKALEAVLIKQGKMPPPDLSQIEAVQMGHVMQPVIGRLAQDKLKLELKEADYALTHPRHDWFRSHFDFISADGKTLVEAKNYNVGVRSKFDTDTNVIPPADLAQLIHEAAVHNVDRAVLAVLFGGQEFCTFEFVITPEQKEELIKSMAKYWGNVQAGTQPEATTVEQTKALFPTSITQSIVATRNLEMAVTQLKDIKQQIKNLESGADALETMIRNTMGENDAIVGVDGSVLATWRSSKPTKRFSSTLFQQAMPDVYESFVVEQPGSRRFLIK